MSNRHRTIFRHSKINIDIVNRDRINILKIQDVDFVIDIVVDIVNRRRVDIVLKFQIYAVDYDDKNRQYRS